MVSTMTSYKFNMMTVDHDVIFLSSLPGIPNRVLTGRLDLEFTRYSGTKMKIRNKFCIRLMGLTNI